MIACNFKTRYNNNNIMRSRINVKIKFVIYYILLTIKKKTLNFSAENSFFLPVKGGPETLNISMTNMLKFMSIKAY